ncbi:MAG TPA: response regulator transcription factor [Candidatus Binatia bacterium]|nr:response regulator transcription factor [Candidatus Binatia bacterium]
MRLLIVEDDLSLVAALRTGLGAAGYAVDAASSAADARALLATNGYDLLVLDLGLPDGEGLDLIRALRARTDDVPVLVLTARGSLSDRVEGLDAGADDYLQKPFAFPELLARLRALLRRGTIVAPAVLRVADLELDPARFEVRRGGVPVALTVKEFSILHYFMRHAGELVTRSMLLEHCWDESYDGLSNLVDVHVSRVRRKLEAAGGPPLLHTVRGAGFVLGERAR